MIFNIQKETPFGVSFLKNSLKDYKPQVRFVIFNGINKQGILQLQKNKMDEWNNRLKALKNQIEYWSKEENKTPKTIEIIQLYYNENKLE